MPVHDEGRPILERRGPGTDGIVSPDGPESHHELATEVQSFASEPRPIPVQFDDRFDKR